METVTSSFETCKTHDTASLTLLIIFTVSRQSRFNPSARATNFSGINLMAATSSSNSLNKSGFLFNMTLSSVSRRSKYFSYMTPCLSEAKARYLQHPCSPNPVAYSAPSEHETHTKRNLRILQYWKNTKIRHVSMFSFLRKTLRISSRKTWKLVFQMLNNLNPIFSLNFCGLNVFQCV